MLSPPLARASFDRDERRAKRAAGRIPLLPARSHDVRSRIDPDETPRQCLDCGRCPLRAAGRGARRRRDVTAGGQQADRRSSDGRGKARRRAGRLLCRLHHLEGSRPPLQQGPRAPGADRVSRRARGARGVRPNCPPGAEAEGARAREDHLRRPAARDDRRALVRRGGRIRDRAVGTCPLSSPVSVNAGNAHLEVSAEGYFTYERDVELPAGGTADSMSFSPPRPALASSQSAHRFRTSP